MPDTYSLQRGMCLKGIGLTAGKKKGGGGIINDSDFKSTSKKMDYHFNFSNRNSNMPCLGQLLRHSNTLTVSKGQYLEFVLDGLFTACPAAVLPPSLPGCTQQRGGATQRKQRMHVEVYFYIGLHPFYYAWTFISLN